MFALSHCFLLTKFSRALFCTSTEFQINAILWVYLRLRQGSCRFADDIYIWGFLQTSLNWVPKASDDKESALVLIMAWCRIGDTPISEPMIIPSLLMHKCVTRPWRVNLWTAEHPFSLNVGSYGKSCPESLNWNIFDKETLLAHQLNVVSHCSMDDIKKWI